MDSLFGRKKASRPRGVSVANGNDLDTAVPYDKLAPSSRSPLPTTNGRPSASMISAPTTNPGLTADGTDLNFNSRRRGERGYKTPDSTTAEDWSGTTLMTNGASSSRNTMASESRTSISTTSSGGRPVSGKRRETDTSSVVSGTSSNPVPGSPQKYNMSDFGNYGRPSSPRPGTTGTRPSSTATLKNDLYRYSAATVNKYAPQVAIAAGDIQDRLAHFHLAHHSQDEFSFPKPENPADIEAMFAQIKATRDMPESYDPPLDAKWSIVHSHEQLRWQEERSKMLKRAAAGAGGQTPGASSYSKDAPEWYLKKFMDQTITPKHVSGLQVILRTSAIGCVSRLINSGPLDVTLTDACADGFTNLSNFKEYQY